MDDAQQDIGRRIVELARLAVLMHMQQEQDAPRPRTPDACPKAASEGGQG